MTNKISAEVQVLVNHYQKRFQPVNLKVTENANNITETIHFRSPMIKAGNHPRIFCHGKLTNDVIILTHGLSDSPHFVKAIGEAFYHAGCNVILTLLPGHGLKDAGDKMRQEHLKKKWKHEIDTAVKAAKCFGKRISLGGFSTGACLSVNKAIRNPKMISGGLFLFSAALDLGYVAHGSNYMPFAHTIARYTDEKFESIGTNPYRYPYINNAAGVEVVRLVDETWNLLGDKKIKQPVFIAHSVHDARVHFAGIQTFITNNCNKAFTFLISENIAHSQLVLKKDITLDPSQEHGNKIPSGPNPKFNWMMENAVRFFKDEVAK